jgi:hypothetical protein
MASSKRNRDDVDTDEEEKNKKKYKKDSDDDQDDYTDIYDALDDDDDTDDEPEEKKGTKIPTEEHISGIKIQDCLRLQWSEYTAMTDEFWMKYPLKGGYGYKQLFGESFVNAIVPNDLIGCVLDYMDWLDEALSYYKERYQTALMFGITAGSLVIKDIPPTILHSNAAMRCYKSVPDNSQVCMWSPFRSGLIPALIGVTRSLETNQLTVVHKSHYYKQRRPVGSPSMYATNDVWTAYLHTDADGLLHNLTGPAFRLSPKPESTGAYFDITIYAKHGVLDAPPPDDDSKPSLSFHSSERNWLHLYASNGKIGRSKDNEDPSVVYMNTDASIISEGWFVDGELHRDAHCGKEQPAYHERATENNKQSVTSLCYSNGFPKDPHEAANRLPKVYSHIRKHIRYVLSSVPFIVLHSNTLMLFKDDKSF